MNKKLMFGLGSILLICVAVIAYFNFNNNGAVEVKTPEEEQTSQTLEELDEDAQETTNLVAVGRFVGDGSGTATRQIKEGKLIHTITAELSIPEVGKFYEGWLVKGSEFFSTGKLFLKEDGTYFLEYKDAEDKSSYSEVVITLETEANGLDGIPETHVLEGEF